MTAIPRDEGWDFGLPPGTSEDIEGTWSVGDDGDGSWAVFFDTSSVNGRQIRKRLVGRPGLSEIMLQTDHGSVSFDR
jgi:hypothetical protein